MDAYRTLADAFARLDVAVHCTNHRCWRSGGSLDGPAFVARYGGDCPLDEVIARLRCSRCGWPGSVSLLNAVSKLDERLAPPGGPRIQPPARAAMRTTRSAIRAGDFLPELPADEVRTGLISDAGTVDVSRISRL